jgi:two-component system, NtrC family, response regulator HydG
MPAEAPKKTVLIVDDDTVVGDLFARGLRGAGYDVSVVTSASDGLERAKADHPDLIVLDFRMPLVNGLGFLYRLRESEREQRTPVIVVTGDIPLADDVQAQFDELGAEVRFKPIALEQLVTAARTKLQ